VFEAPVAATMKFPAFLGLSQIAVSDEIALHVFQ
jgi:hypothetical protein